MTVINVKVGTDGVPYTETCCSKFKKEKVEIKWHLKGAPNHQLNGISGLPSPTFSFVSADGTDVIFKNDNKGGANPKTYVYDIAVTSNSDGIMSLGKAIIRNDPG
jgi:hypothetical protein